MVATTREVHLLATQLYALITSDREGLTFYVDASIGVGAGGARWRLGADRGFNAHVFAHHLVGEYVAAPAAPRWVQWACITIDGRARADESEEAARLQGQRLLGRVWRALDGSAERHPLLEQSHDRGYRVWLPLTRGEASRAPELQEWLLQHLAPEHTWARDWVLQRLAPAHTWPADLVREWVLQRLVSEGLWNELFDVTARLSVSPSPRCVVAPCGRGAALLQATAPEDPDDLGLIPWPGSEAPADARECEKSSCVGLKVYAFLEQWERQRRTLSDWLREPEAAWDSCLAPEHAGCGDRDPDAYSLPSDPTGSRDEALN